MVVVVGFAVTVTVTMLGVVGFFVVVALTLDDEGFGSCVTLVVTTAGGVLYDEGNAVSRVEIVVWVGVLVSASVAVVGAALDDELEGLVTPETKASKISLGILATLRSWEKTPLPSWLPNELVLLLGVATARLLLAQARLLTPLGSRAPPCHWLQPVHKKSSCQCVEFVVVVGKMA